MEPKFDVWITIKNSSETINMEEIRNRLEKYRANVKQIGEAISIYARLDTYSDTLGDFIKICREYGEPKTKAKMVRSSHWNRGC